MDRLIQVLQNNSLMVLGMFMVTFLSGVITIYFYWGRFQRDFLCKKVTLPVYVYLIILFIIFLVIIFLPTVKGNVVPLRSIKSEKFGNQRIYMDGKSFENCSFDRTELFFKAEKDVSLVRCEFKDIQFTFGGPAERTIVFLQRIYSNQSFRPIIDNTFEKIKSGSIGKSTPPSLAADE